jgi:hypothetical protein
MAPNPGVDFIEQFTPCAQLIAFSPIFGCALRFTPCAQPLWNPPTGVIKCKLNVNKNIIILTPTTKNIEKHVLLTIRSSLLCSLDWWSQKFGWTKHGSTPSPSGHWIQQEQVPKLFNAKWSYKWLPQPQKQWKSGKQTIFVGCAWKAVNLTGIQPLNHPLIYRK